MMIKKNKTAIILGSDGVLGSQIVQELLQDDISVVGIDKHKKSDSLCSSYLSVDFAKQEEISRAIDGVSSYMGEDNILISTVGIFGNNYEKMGFDYNMLLRTIQVNLLSVSEFCLGISKVCVENKKKLRIVIVGSTASFVGSRDIGYGISKSGLNGLVISLSKCFAKKDVTTIGVNPGIFTSSMSKSVSSDRQNQAIDSTHVKRAGEISEISNTIVYAAMHAPDFLTGSFININGGQYV